MKNLYLVCTGNTCRSPMAQVILEDLFSQNRISGFNVQSRACELEGEHLEGLNLNPNTAEIIKELRPRDHPIFSHRSKTFTEEDLRSADIILTMTAEQELTVKSFMRALGIHKQHCVTTIGKASGDFNTEIFDPIGQSLDVYRKTYVELHDLLRSFVAKLRGRW